MDIGLMIEGEGLNSMVKRAGGVRHKGVKASKTRESQAE